MKKTINTLLLLVAVILSTAACKQTKEDPAPIEKQNVRMDLRIAPTYFTRYVNSSGAHYYIPRSEIETVSVPAGFMLEGNLCLTFSSVNEAALMGYKGAVVPLYSYFNRINGDSFHTTNFQELGNGNSAYAYLGIKTYVCADNLSAQSSSLAPVYRYYHPVFGSHFYTNNINELASNNYGYRYEGIAFYGGTAN